MGFNQAPALPYRNLGIVQDGDTASQSIEKDKYVIWKGGNYFAKTDILQGETFVVDTNLTEITEGAINGIVEALTASTTEVISLTKGGTLTIIKSGNIVTIHGNKIGSISAYPTSQTNVIYTLPEKYRPRMGLTVWGGANGAINGADGMGFSINATGVIDFYGYKACTSGIFTATYIV